MRYATTKVHVALKGQGIPPQLCYPRVVAAIFIPFGTL